MSKHLGDYDASAVIYGKFTTYRPSTGASFTLGGTPALSVYKDNSTTQSTTGVTLTADFDSVTGLNHFAIDTSADGTFYAAGSFFDIVITTGTVDSVSVVGSVVASFTIRKDSSLKPTTAARTLDVSAGGEAGIDWANVGSPTTAVNLSATNIDVDQVVASVSGAVGSVTGAVGSVTGAVGSVTGAVGSVTGNVGGNVVGSVGSVTGLTAANLDVAVSTRLATAGYTAPDNTSIAAILVDTAEIGVAGAGLTNINPPNQTMDITGNITGNLSGSVGSVTGAVGSVTGNVGGNVTGSVGSVVGAVGSVTGNVGGNVVGSVASVTAAVAITSNVKKNQALGKFQFLMTDSTNHAPSTGLTVTVTRSIDGAAFAAGTLSAVTEIGNGMYYVDFGSGDLNGNVITLQATAAASDTTFATIVTQP